jgi:hypothetical protein
MLTVENKYASMKDALLWCYIPTYLYYSIKATKRKEVFYSGMILNKFKG